MTQPRPVAGFHSIIIREQDKDVYRKYQVIEVLGQGSMGSVSRVQVRSDRIGGSAVRHTQSMGLLGLLKGKRRTGKVDASHAHEYALKTVIVDRVSSTFLEELRNEIDILKTLDHPNIVRLHEVYSHRKQIYLILDLCERGDLYSRVPYSEREAAKFIGQLVSAITYMHQHGVVHRDLKFENIMFEDEETIKVIDFGLSKKFAGGVPEYMSERVGTIATMAPQVLQGIYSEKADSWSIGVIAFMMLGNRKPFYSKNRRQMVDWIMRAQYNFEGVMWGKVSEKGKDFVSRLLVVDPGVRMSPEMALRHEWLLQQEQWQDARPSIELLRKLDSSLYNYKHVLVIKKLALNVIAHRSTSEQIVELRRIFEEFDKNRNGVVTFDEFKSALAHSSLSEDALQEIFDSVDINKDGNIMYTEFLAATIEAQGVIAEDRIAEAFDRLDSDGTGYISKEDLFSIMGDEYGVEGIIESVDMNKDGQISYQEFLAAFRHQTELVVDKALKVNDDAKNV